MKVFSYMARGDCKAVSEDTILVGQKVLKEGFHVFDGSPACIAIADGVGGNTGGREASEFIISKIGSLDANELLKSASELNDSLISFAKTVPGKEKMATTLSGIFFTGEHNKLLHVGNTRVFAAQGAYLKQLTKDHTTAEWLRSRGQYEAAENAPGNEITACFGSGNRNSFQQFSVIDIERDYKEYVITSDGIHDYLDTEEIEDFLSGNDLNEESFVQLVNKAKENGSADDKSIVVIITRA